MRELLEVRIARANISHWWDEGLTVPKEAYDIVEANVKRVGYDFFTTITLDLAGEGVTDTLVRAGKTDTGVHVYYTFRLKA